METITKIDFERALLVFEKEVALQKSGITRENDVEEADKRIKGVEAKVIHTQEVIKDGEEVMQNLGFVDNNLSFGKVALLNHDIGRFMQMRSIGSFKDNELYQQCFIKNHGELGCMVLDRIIKDEIPNTRLYDGALKEIVRNHVNGVNPIEHLSILNNGILQGYDISELLQYKEISRQVISTYTQIVQDVDRLDIYHQILEGRFTPVDSMEPISKEVLQKFYNGEYLDIAELRRTGLWNANVGDLVRLSFIDQIKLLSVAKLIKDENLIIRMKQSRKNPYTDEAFEYANDKLEEMIKNSPDGILVGPVKVLK